MLILLRVKGKPGPIQIDAGLKAKCTLDGSPVNSVWLPGDFLAERIPSALFYPGSQAVEAGPAGDVIHKENCVHVTIEMWHHRLTEALLSRCVPKLELVIQRTQNRME